MNQNETKIWESMKNYVNSQIERSARISEGGGVRVDVTPITAARIREICTHTGEHIGGSAARNLYYTSGDTISFGNLYVNGTLTENGKTLYFTIPSDKPIINVSATTVTWWNGIVRHEGSYLVGTESGMVDFKNIGTVSVVDLNYLNAITMKVQFYNQIGSIDNCGVALNLQGGIALS